VRSSCSRRLSLAGVEAGQLSTRLHPVSRVTPTNERLCFAREDHCGASVTLGCLVWLGIMLGDSLRVLGVR